MSEAEASPRLLRVNSELSIPVAEVALRTSRSSGPGGQHANVTASRVEAVFDVAASQALSEAQRARLLERLGPRVTAVAQDNRSQLRNRELAQAVDFVTVHILPYWEDFPISAEQAGAHVDSIRSRAPSALDGPWSAGRARRGTHLWRRFLPAAEFHSTLPMPQCRH